MEVGKRLRASTGSPVITADVKCLQRDGGGGETAAFTLYSKPHTYPHTHSHLYERLELYWKPHKPCSVYVCLCYSWPPGPVAETDRLTHISPPPPTAAECGDWTRASWMLADQIS